MMAGGSRRSAAVVVGLALLGLASCQRAPSDAGYLPFILVTAAPNASPTPTPFQPSASSPTPMQLGDLVTETPSPTPSAAPLPSATADLGSLFPTAAAPPSSGLESQPSPLPPLGGEETVNFLLVGSDKRPGSSYRTDTLLIAIVWPAKGQASLISIPRDLWIYIPSVGMQRINTAYQSGELSGYPGGGPGLLREAIAYNLGIRIDHTALVEFDGFRRIIDTLGGIEVPISCPYTDWRLIDPSYDPYNEDNWWLYSVGPGQIHMDGDLALWYARSRSKSSDFDRGRRQQEVLRAILSKALKTDTIGKIPLLYSELSAAVVTDVSLADLLRLAPYAARFSSPDVRSYYIRPPLVSAWMTPGGASVQLPNEDALSEMIRAATTYSEVSVYRKAVRVEVQNATFIESLEFLAASRLNYAGYDAVPAPAGEQGSTVTMLVDLTAEQDPAARQSLAHALGLPAAPHLAEPSAGGDISYRVILGSDYEACFEPQDLSH